MSIARQFGLQSAMTTPIEKTKSKSKATGGKTDPEEKPKPAKTPKAIGTGASLDELAKKVAEIETKKAPAPKKGKADYQKVKKGRPKKGDGHSEPTVVMSFRVPKSIAEAVKQNSSASDAVIAALRAIM